MLKPSLITQYLGTCVILQTSWPGTEEGSGTLLLMLKPQQYKILPLCGFAILLSALKAVFSEDFSFKIYACEKELLKAVLGYFTFSALQQSVHKEWRGRRLLYEGGRLMFENPVVLSVGGGKKRHQKHEAI